MPHKWVEEQQRHYGLKAALGCVLLGRLSRTEPRGGMMPSCSPKTWRWQPVLQGLIEVHSAWDASLKCTPLWPSISGFTVEGENTLVLWEVLVSEGIQTINSYPEKYVAHIQRGLSHEVSNFYWKFSLDMTTIVWIYTIFIEDIHSSSPDFFFFQDSIYQLRFLGLSSHFKNYFHYFQFNSIKINLIQWNNNSIQAQEFWAVFK